jgi:hypothetical protein
LELTRYKELHQELYKATYSETLTAAFAMRPHVRFAFSWEDICRNIQGGSDKSGIFFFLLSNDTAKLKIIRFD